MPCTLVSVKPRSGGLETVSVKPQTGGLETNQLKPQGKCDLRTSGGGLVTVSASGPGGLTSNHELAFAAECPTETWNRAPGSQGPGGGRVSAEPCSCCWEQGS